MARRRRGRRRGGKKSKTIPVLPTVAALYPAYAAYAQQGLNAGLPVTMVYKYTGYDISANKWTSPHVGWGNLGLIIGMTLAHKIANKTGINRHVRKATMGYLSL